MWLMWFLICGIYANYWESDAILRLLTLRTVSTMLGGLPESATLGWIDLDRPSIHHSDRPHLTFGSCIHPVCCKSLKSPQDVFSSKMARVGGLTTMKERAFLSGHCRQQQFPHDDIVRGWRSSLACGDYWTRTGDIPWFSGNSFHSYWQTQYTSLWSTSPHFWIVYPPSLLQFPKQSARCFFF